MSESALDAEVQRIVRAYLEQRARQHLVPIEAYLRRHGLTCPRCGGPWELVYYPDPDQAPFLRCQNPACACVPQIPR